MISDDINSSMIKISQPLFDNEINKKRKLDINGAIPPWRNEMILFIEQFKKIIEYNIHIGNKNNYIKIQNIINCTNFFDVNEDLPIVMPIIYIIVNFINKMLSENN